MRSSISGSESTRAALAVTIPGGAAQPGFFGRGLALIGLTLAAAIAVGHLIGAKYNPQRLAPTVADVSASDRFIVLFGNSRLETAVDIRQLAVGLGGDNARLGISMFSGGGWDSIHYYQLALLSKDVLRPGRDTVLIETSPLSMDDANIGNRLGVIRPTAALEVAAVPGTPLEDRLEVLL